VHAPLAGGVGSGGDDAALGRVAVAADDQRLAVELRMPQDLDGSQELVEVHVQHPAGHTVRNTI
jgi:hypothetical protein